MFYHKFCLLIKACKIFEMCVLHKAAIMLVKDNFRFLITRLAGFSIKLPKLCVVHKEAIYNGDKKSQFISSRKIWLAYLSTKFT